MECIDGQDVGVDVQDIEILQAYQKLGLQSFNGLHSFIEAPLLINSTVCFYGIFIQILWIG